MKFNFTKVSVPRLIITLTPEFIEEESKRAARAGISFEAPKESVTLRTTKLHHKPEISKEQRDEAHRTALEIMALQAARKKQPYQFKK
jgi:hypothetical protein